MMEFCPSQFHLALAILCLSCHPCHSFTPQTYTPESLPSSTTKLKSTPTNEGYITVLRPNNTQHKLSYRIARPMALSSKQAAPIITLHGGPSLPSSYMYQLEKVIPYRSIVYYDQLGCGASDQPRDVNLYSIKDSVEDLKVLIKQLGIRRFHLYGHSYGGILAFEYLKNVAITSKEEEESTTCLSAILSSAPPNIPQLEKEFVRLTEILTPQDRDISTGEMEESFRINYQCRTEHMPEELAEAYANVGTVWCGTAAIAEYVASPPSTDAMRMPSAMVMRGQFDFVGHDSFEAWKAVFNHKFVRCKTLEGCSHHGLYENGLLYGETVDDYFAEYD